MRSVVVFAVLALTAGIVVPRYAVQISAKPATAALGGASATPVAASAATSRSVIVPRDGRGHFQIEARIEGKRIFMVDTGASVVALTKDRGAVRIRPSPGQYAQVTTANGTIKAARTRLAMLDIGGLVVRDVDAMVLPDEALRENLLGLSFLSRLRRFEYSAGRLVLEQ